MYRIFAGRSDYPQWVRSYSVATSMDGTSWQYVMSAAEDGGGGGGAIAVFEANFDHTTSVSNSLRIGVVGRHVRLMPRLWHGHISMRVEFLGCESPSK